MCVWKNHFNTFELTTRSWLAAAVSCQLFCSRFFSHIMHIFNIESCDATSDTVFLYVHKAFTRSRMSFNEIESRENVFFHLLLLFDSMHRIHARHYNCMSLFTHLKWFFFLKLKVLSLSKLLIHIYLSIYHVSQHIYVRLFTVK